MSDAETKTKITNDLKTCDECGLILLAADMAAHKAHDHGADKGKGEPMNNHLCEYCGKSFGSRRQVAGHQRWCKAKAGGETKPAKRETPPKKRETRSDLSDVSITELKGELVRRLKERMAEYQRYLDALGVER